MSTYNRLTIESTTAAPLDLDRLRAALEQHAGWTDEVTEFDGEALDYDMDWRPTAAAPDQHWVIVQDRVSASWHSKWAFTLDGKPWADLTTFLGPDYRLRFLEEWDDDGIGRTEQVWSDGSMSGSTTLRDVSDALGAWDNALLSPTILSWDQVTDSAVDLGHPLADLRFLLLPPA